MFKFFTRSPKEKAGPFDGWSPVVNKPWEGMDYPSLPDSRSRVVDHGQLTRLEKKTILLIGDSAEKEGWDALMHLSGEFQYDLAEVSVVAVLVAAQPPGRIPNQKLSYQRFRKNNLDGFEDLVRSSPSPEITIVLDLEDRLNTGFLLNNLFFLKQNHPEINVFGMVPLSVTPQILEDIRELERFTLVAPHIAGAGNGDFTPLRDTSNTSKLTQVVNEIFYTTSSGWMMSEILYAWMHPDSRNAIDQFMINITSRKQNLVKQSGEPHLALVTASALYLPLAEHRDFLNAALGRAVLFGLDQGQGGFFNNTTHDNLAGRFMDFYSEHSHPIYKWVLSDLSINKPVDYPSLKGGEGQILYISFCKHLATFLHKQLQSEVASIKDIICILSELSGKYNNAYGNTNGDQRELLVFLSACKSKLSEVQEQFQEWEKAIYGKKHQLAGLGDIDNLDHRMANYEKSTKEALQALLRRTYSLPALDGDLARDPGLNESLQRRINDDRLYQKFFWKVDFQDTKQCVLLTLNLVSDDGWKTFTEKELSEEFQLVLDLALANSISNLQSAYTENQFLEAAMRKAASLNTVQKSAIKYDGGTGTSQSCIFSKDLTLSGEFSRAVFGNGAQNIQKISGYPPGRISALRMDVNVPLAWTDIYKNSYRGLNSAHCHKEEEKLAMEIEKKCFFDDKHRYLSLELIVSLTDPQPVEVFFKALFTGMFEWKVTAANLGIEKTHEWVLRSVESADGKFFAEQSFTAGHEDSALAVLANTFIEFTLSRRYYGTSIEQSTSPFHINNWSKYLGAIQYNADKKLNKKTLVGSRASLSKLFGYSLGKTKPETGFYPTDFSTELKLENRWLEHDFLALMHYYFDKSYFAWED